MSANTEDNPAYANLFQLLEDKEGLDTLMSASDPFLDPAQTAALYRLAQHLAELHGYDTEAEPQMKSNRRRRDSTGLCSGEEQGGGGTGPNKRRRAPSKASPWARFLRLEELTLAPSIKQYLREHGTAPEPFLVDGNALIHEIVDFSDSENISDAFLANYRWTMELEGRAAGDGFRWCFTMMMHFDVVKLVRPKGSGKKISVLMRDEMQELLAPLQDYLDDSLDQVLAHLNKWCVYGSKLDLICKEFGPGCIFFLHQQHLLSQDFLDNKFTSSGQYHKAAFRHLQRLNLGGKAQASQANELGQKIRHRLIKPFMIAAQARDRRSGTERRHSVRSQRLGLSGETSN
ncbi:MAG: hypothetical protein Q9202_000236 [Teloschistes flavicans]